MNALTLEVILQVVFGVTDEARLDRLRPLVNATVDVSPAGAARLGLPGAAAVRSVEAGGRGPGQLDELIYAEIAERRAATDLADAQRRAVPAAAGRGPRARRR